MDKEELKKFIDKIPLTGPGGVDKIKRVLLEIIQGEGGTVTEDELQEALSDKQDVIEDLKMIRKGAAAGSSAYQKPTEGIPEDDLSESVQDKLNGPMEHGSGQNSAQQIDSGAAAIGDSSFAESSGKSSGLLSHAEGYYSEAIGSASHSEGNKTIAVGNYSHSEGIGGIVNSGLTFSGNGTSYTTTTAHGFTVNTVLKFRDVVAKVVSVPATTSFTTDVPLSETAVSDNTDLYIVAGTALGESSHSEGDSTIAIGDQSHAEGLQTKAKGTASHAEGSHTEASNVSEHAEGRYNKSNKASVTFGNAGNTIHSVGIGTSNARKNAFEIMQNGDAYLLGIGGYDGTNPSSAQSVQQVIADLLNRIQTLESNV